MESVETEKTKDSLSGFEPVEGAEKVSWNGREVTIFPYNRYYFSGYRRNFWAMLWTTPSTIKPENNNYKCRLCNSELVDFFNRYEIEPVDTYGMDDEEEEEELCKPRIIGALFERTCKNCINGDNPYKIFSPNGDYLWKTESYIIPIGITTSGDIPYRFDEPGMVSDTLKGPTLFQRFKAFIDNSNVDLADINEAFIAGFFRSFGVIRDSVDFFVTVGDFLKQKIGIDKKTEKSLCAKESELSSETVEAIKDISRPSNLELFRRTFATGEEVQKAALNNMGIKYEPNTPFKRVLEELGAAGPFGPLWMAISGIGQVGLESGLITHKEKPFYEIGLAILCLKAVNLGKNIPSSKQMMTLSKSLAEAEIDLSKIQAGKALEIAKAEKEVSKFVETLEQNPVKRSSNPSCVVFADNGKIKSIPIADMSHAGTFIDRGDFTKVGRALQKKSDRAGSVFPKPTGTPAEVNLKGQKVLDEILNHPDKNIRIRSDATVRMGYEVLDIRLPDGRGARFTKDGKEMICFLEPKR